MEKQVPEAKSTGLFARRQGAMERKRRAVLAKQREQREEVTEAARAAQLAAFVQQQKREHLLRYVRQLMHPEWLCELPADLHESWTLCPRPEGRRSLVVATRGRTTSRSKHGSVQGVFQSALPNGSRATAGGSSGVTILDCIYQARTNTFYAVDVLCWRGVWVTDSPTDFRRHWLVSRLQETDCHTAGPDNKHRFAPLPWVPCTREGLTMAYDPPPPQQAEGEARHDGKRVHRVGGFVQDGILFMHDEAHYTGGLSPLMLVWKDRWTSAYFIDSAPNRTSEGDDGDDSRQRVVVEVGPNGRDLCCADGHIVGRLPDEFKADKPLRPGCLLRFSIQGIGQRGELDGMAFEAAVSGARLLPDAWSKVLFQWMARTGQAIKAEAIGERLQ